MKCDISADGRTYTFTLRQGVMFHNGQELTAQDVKASLQRYGRVGGSAPIMTPVESIMPASEGDKDRGKINHIGTGPYPFVEFKPDSHVTLKRFDRYTPNTNYAKRDGFSGRKTAYFDTVAFRSAMTVALLGLSLPDFRVGLVMIYTFAVLLGWFPTGGYVELGKGVRPWLGSMIMPSFALGITQLGLLARITRATMLEVLSQDYVRTARAKGLPERAVIDKHALSNAMIPVVTVRRRGSPCCRV